jgi:hypothetical protein
MIEEFQPQSANHHIRVTRYAGQLLLSQRIVRMECVIAQSQIDEAWQKFWGPQPLPTNPPSTTRSPAGSLPKTGPPTPLAARPWSGSRSTPPSSSARSPVPSACCAVRRPRNKIATSNPFLPPTRADWHGMARPSSRNCKNRPNVRKNPTADPRLAPASAAPRDPQPGSPRE